MYPSLSNAKTDSLGLSSFGESQRGELSLSIPLPSYMGTLGRSTVNTSFPDNSSDISISAHLSSYISFHCNLHFALIYLPTRWWDLRLRCSVEASNDSSFFLCSLNAFITLGIWHSGHTSCFLLDVQKTHVITTGTICYPRIAARIPLFRSLLFFGATEGNPVLDGGSFPKGKHFMTRN